jgi:hypothetical protein
MAIHSFIILEFFTTAVDKILNKAEQMELRPSYINYSTVKIWLQNLIFM